MRDTDEGELPRMTEVDRPREDVVWAYMRGKGERGTGEVGRDVEDHIRLANEADAMQPA